MNTRACRKNSEPCGKHARIEEYSIDLVENTSLQNPHTLTHVSPSCDFTCDWSKLNARPTPWEHGLSTICESLVAISHAIGRNWPDRLSSTSWITYWLAIAYRQVNKLFFRLSVYLRMRSRHEKQKVQINWKWELILLLGAPYTESPSQKMQQRGSWSQAFHA